MASSSSHIITNGRISCVYDWLVFHSVYIYTHTHTHTHTHIYIYTHTDIYIYIHTHTHIPSLLDHPPFPHLTYLGYHRTPNWAPLLYIQQVPTSSLFYIWWCTYKNPSLPIHPPPCPYVYSLHPHLYSCPAKRLICTVFLDSKYMY